MPVNQTINHWFFGLFLLSTLIIIVTKREIDINFNNIKVLLLFSCVSFFLLRLLTIIYAPDVEEATKEMVRALPFILYPFAILDFKNTKEFNFRVLENKVFWFLSFGCSLTMILAWGNILVNMEPNPIPAEQFFGWKKSGIYLTAFLDLHPPYLGLLFSASIVFLFREIATKRFNPKVNGFILFWALTLVVFVFHLTSRNALFFLLLIGFIYFLRLKKWRLLLLMGVILSIGVTVIVTHPSKYYRLKMYHMLGLSENDDLTDKRFNRLTASLNVFKSSPIIGVGVGNDTEMRVKEYLILGETIAAQKRLNSHNQFFEYLVAYGIIGGIVFIVAIILFLNFLITKNQYFYLILFLSIICASITESIFERALGIQYYSVIISMALLKNIFNLNPSSTKNVS
jgi:O-antigen ligase